MGARLSWQPGELQFRPEKNPNIHNELEPPQKTKIAVEAK